MLGSAEYGAVTHRLSFNCDVSRWVSQELYPSYDAEFCTAAACLTRLCKSDYS
jgi:hypothetical protein